MPSVPYFSSPFPQGPKATALGSSLSKVSGKRKRDESEDDQNDGDLSPPEDYKNVPHASRPPKEKSNQVLSLEKLEVELSRLKPPVYQAQSHTTFDRSSDSPLLRQRHSTVVTAMMHKCLLDGDFIRAGRALSMLLRAGGEYHGQPFDIRMHDRWGIGAEILLRRDAQAYVGHEEAPSENSGLDIREEDSIQRGIEFSKMGIEKAKIYYETLILEYPYRSSKPHAISSLQFHPAMLGLWIYSVEQQHKQALATTTGDDSEQFSDDVRDIGNSIETAPSSEPMIASQDRVRLSILQEARKVDNQLEQLLLSPPYADDVSLWKLQSMVCFWLGDLCIPIDLPLLFPTENESESTSGEDFEDDLLGRRLRIARNRKEYEECLSMKETYVERGKRAQDIAVDLGNKAKEKLGEK
ncbi:hypothetical protein MMC14_008137 [Varicellaria rhodocarpa]|nr:hypothetical protein [Varicellaria rhodocarpa]